MVLAESGSIRLWVDPAEGRIVDANEAALRFYGYSREEFAQLKITDIGLDVTDAYAYLERPLAFPHRLKSGEVRNMMIFARSTDHEGKIIVEVCSCDVADWKNAHSTLEAIPTPVFVRDTQGVFTFCNSAYSALLGKPREEIVGRTLFDLFPLPTATKGYQKDRELLISPSKQVFETRMCFAEGKTLDVVFHKAPVYGSSGEVIGVTGAVFDVTERKRVEQSARHLEIEKENLRERLSELEKFVALGTLASGAAHEINNPLTIVFGNLELLKDDAVWQGAWNEKSEELYRRTGEALERIAKVTEGIRILGGVDIKQSEFCDFHAVIKKVLSQMFTGWLELQINVGLHLEAVAPFVYADKNRLTQMVQHLVSNAQDALLMRESGREVVISTRSDEEMIVFTVEDNGYGIPEEALPQIFDPFFTTKEPGKGVGLGLAIVSSIVKALRGTIRVKSVAGMRTYFRIELPRGKKTE